VLNAEACRLYPEVVGNPHRVPPVVGTEDT
jgi:hypothetical protein